VSTGIQCRVMEKTSVAVLDVETTGFSPGAGDRVCEVALVVVEGVRIVDRFETLVNPEREIPNSHIHGVHDSMVKRAPLFADVFPTLMSYLQGRYLVAHNAAFDHGFLESEVRYGYGAKYGLEVEGLCTKLWAWHKFGHGHGSLDYLCGRLRIANDCPHHALPDAVAEAQVLLKFLGRGGVTVENLENARKARAISVYGAGPLPRLPKRTKFTPRIRQH